MSARRSFLRVVRLSVVLQTVFAVVFLVACYYFRRRIASQDGMVDALVRYNLQLSSDLRRAQYVLTNYYFSAASSFASNVVASVVSSVVVTNAVAGSLPVSNVLVKADKDLALPPFKWRRYCEIDGEPCVCLGNKLYRAGDVVLGYPIEYVSPSVVSYRGKFYEVEQ